MKPDIDHDQLTTLLHYDPDTGEFTQKLRWWNRKPGDKPGGKTPQGYWYIGVGGKQYPAHRLAWFYVHKNWPNGDIDHINRNRLDNRIANLREVTRSRNLHNTSDQNPVSGHKGVYMTKEKTWEARIMVDYVDYRLGRYRNPEDAADARKFAEKLFFGS
ncbi:HNH nuclease [uncultured Caudovirales phage]|uniref:HNH nuclease n=1 Tax=uncultured Caudovirales phage TaxID=2100421 RepID=A0A6J5L099_9CAUD|nr:HNH nuclease [uncultured Caudovirales phage]CAB4133113.1 HNH nuclease [uncultured Caudovirales phage]